MGRGEGNDQATALAGGRSLFYGRRSGETVELPSLDGQPVLSLSELMVRARELTMQGPRRLKASGSELLAVREVPDAPGGAFHESLLISFAGDYGQVQLQRQYASGDPEDDFRVHLRLAALGPLVAEIPQLLTVRSDEESGVLSIWHDPKPGVSFPWVLQFEDPYQPDELGSIALTAEEFSLIREWSRAKLAATA